ncbi:PspC domain-containing protein [Cellulomonas wangsupingiae]|uniref:PspC domain-containing protein n=1 Tax=Cellulomonas wangsupingiae TaxID=2968085 RepID=UPI001D0E8371|nr:PspC domain-containing protein [Cellulomonas wangsupingiae]MCM0639846.1 PspC domain-containing protein [Cellulomonas wangsupingiae]
MDTQTPAGADAGTPGPTPGAGPGPYPGTTPPPAPHTFWAGVRRTGLYRSDERWVGGVAGGLAERVGVDPLLVRGVLAVTFLVGGLGLVLYGVAWALLPDQRDGRILLERLGAGDADGALLGSLAFVVVGFARGDGWWWFWDGGGGLFGAIAVVSAVAIVALIATAVQRRDGGTAWRPPAGAPPYGTEPAPGAPTGPSAAWTRPVATAPLPTAGPGSAGPAAPAPPYPPYGGAPVPPLPPPPPAPRPARRGADGATVGAVVGLSVIGLGVVMLLERAGLLGGPVWLVAGGIALVVAGLGIVALGLRGRSSGFVGFLAVAGALVWVPTAMLHQGAWADAAARWDGDRAGDVAVTSRDVASSGFDLGAGRSRIDLTQVPLEDEVLRVPIDIGTGQLTVVVPPEAAVRADVTVGIGSVRFEVDEDRYHQSGVGLGDLVYQDDDAAAGTPNLVLEISAGVGEVRIIEEDAA